MALNEPTLPNRPDARLPESAKKNRLQITHPTKSRSRRCGNGLRVGARGRNRTGMTVRSRDFLTTSTFAAALLNAGRSWSGARLHHSLAAVGARRLLSTPSQAAAWAWLGVGSGARASRAFADFDGLHFGRFPPKAQIVQVPCVYRFHHSGVVLNALKTPTSIYWRLAGPWPSSLAAKLQLGCPQTVVTIDLLAR